MKFKKIQQKNIQGLNYIGDVSPQGIENLESSFNDLFLLNEDVQIESFERQIDEDKNKRTILAKLPESYRKVNNKQQLMRNILQEEIDSENIKKVLSIRYYSDNNNNLYLQIIFEMP